MNEELKPCPFCGEKPELPSGDGTQYEIECGGCGQAMASVQICDLMTIEERAADEFTNYRYAEEFVERAKVEAIANWNLRAQPAEAEGVEMGSDAWMALHLLDRLDVSADEEPRVQQVEEIVRRMGAALSAVTAERDRLRKDAERYRWASSGVHEAETLVSIVNCHGGYAEKVAERVDVYREAAMAAKEE